VSDRENCTLYTNVGRRKLYVWQGGGGGWGLRPAGGDNVRFSVCSAGVVRGAGGAHWPYDALMQVYAARPELDQRPRPVDDRVNPANKRSRVPVAWVRLL